MTTATQRTLERFTAKFAVSITRKQSEFGAFYTFTEQSGAILYQTTKPAEAVAFCAGYEAALAAKS